MFVNRSIFDEVTAYEVKAYKMCASFFGPPCIWFLITKSNPDSNPNQWRRNEFESGGGGTDSAQSAGKFFWSPLLFGSKSTISRFGERFRDGQYSLVSFLFVVLLPTVPPVPSHL